MNILMLSWRGPSNPKKGGAEVLTLSILKELVKRGHTITWLTTEDSQKEQKYTRINIIKKGHILSVLFYAYRYYKQQKQDIDLVIDQINTIPFFTPLYVKKNKRIGFIHQFAKEVWWYEVSCTLIAAIGRISEMIYMRFYKSTAFITVSESTKTDLENIGVKEKITIIQQAIISSGSGNNLSQKTKRPTIVHLGRIAPMKRVHRVLKTVQILKQQLPNIQYTVIGKANKAYKKKLLMLIKKYNIEENVTLTGFVTTERRNQLIGEAHVIMTAAVREGWGLNIIEANLMGTPAISYNIPGSRDAIKHNTTGILVKKNTSKNLANAFLSLITRKAYPRMCKEAQKEAQKLCDIKKTTDQFEQACKNQNTIA